jgi:hypothetical protein
MQTWAHHWHRHNYLKPKPFLILIFLPIFIMVAAGSTQAVDVTQTSITITWTSTGDNGTEGCAAQYDIRYSTMPINSLNWNNAMQAVGEPYPQPAGSQESFTLENLIPDTRYYIAVKVADEVPNWSGMSNVVDAKTLSLSLDIGEETDELPSQFELGQNYPNPFNPATRIDYSLPTAERVTIAVFNILGQHIKTIVDEFMSAGQYTVMWDGSDESGLKSASGVYLYRIRAGNYSAVKKMVLVQ